MDISINWLRSSGNSDGSSTSAEQYIDQLIADGWSLIGHGGYARVLTKDGVVVKIFRRDPAYLKFLQHVMCAAPNRAHPQIISVMTIDGADEEFHVVTMERLQPFDASRRRGDFTLGELLKSIQELASETAKSAGASLRACARWLLDAMTPDEISLLDHIVDMARDGIFRPDLESWNVMMCGDDELVFVDPLLRVDGILGFDETFARAAA
jgi:hypothetical protein